MKRIKIIANKSWEADPLINALTNSQFKPKDLPHPVFINQPCLTTRGAVHVPRLVYELNRTIVEVWCIEDQMNPSESSSNTNEKIRILPNILSQSEEPNLVVAFGTAAYPDPNKNGSVLCGSYFFMHNGSDPSILINGTEPYVKGISWEN